LCFDHLPKSGDARGWGMVRAFYTSGRDRDTQTHMQRDSERE
jgi:hypothetical protein